MLYQATQDKLKSNRYLNISARSRGIGAFNDLQIIKIILVLILIAELHRLLLLFMLLIILLLIII